MFEEQIVPMEPRSSSFFKNDPCYRYQVKWDGIRLLAFGKSGKLRLQGRSLKDKTALYPEFALLTELVREHSFILDGELVAFENNRPSFYAVMRRERSGAKGAEGAARATPVHYIVFDLLMLDGSCCMEKPWELRQELLRASVLESDRLHVTPNYEDGAALLQAVKEKGLEGIVAKKKGSPYIPGPRKSAYWLKTKVEQTLQAYIGGIALRGNRPASLLLGLKDTGGDAGVSKEGGGLLYIGSASAGLGAEELRRLHAWGRQNSRPDTPFSSIPLPRGRDILWVHPSGSAVVAFSEWTPEIKMRSPRILSLSLHTRGNNESRDK